MLSRAASRVKYACYLGHPEARIPDRTFCKADRIWPRATGLTGHDPSDGFEIKNMDRDTSPDGCERLKLTFEGSMKGDRLQNHMDELQTPISDLKWASASLYYAKHIL